MDHAQRVKQRPPRQDLIALLRAKYRWPSTAILSPDLGEEWFGADHRRILGKLLPPRAGLVIELGSWLGRSARWFAARSNAVVCIDHWLGSAEHQDHPSWSARLPCLYDQFCANLWDLRERVVPVRDTTLAGLRACAGLQPDLVYVDAAHDAESVAADVYTARHLFPDAVIAGDDYPWESVRLGLETTGLAHAADGPVWWLT